MNLCNLEAQITIFIIKITTTWNIKATCENSILYQYGFSLDDRGNDITKQPLVLVFIIVLGIFFTTDPTPTIAEDTTDKTSDRCLYENTITQTSNNKNGKNDEKKIQDIKHFCPVCNSNMLTFEGLSTSHGEMIQLVNCKICSFEWQETWTLPNWLWLKSSQSDNHWTSDRWNIE